MSKDVKPNFFTRMFSGKNTEGGTANAPTPDANGQVSFSAEQFATLETVLENLETEVKTATENFAKHSGIAASLADLEKKYTDLAENVTAHGERLEKLKTVPAVKPAATGAEPPMGAAADEADGIEESPVAIALREAQQAGETIRITA
jgi:hypothetical protein